MVASRPNASVDFENFTGDVFLKIFTGMKYFYRYLSLTGDVELMTGDPRWYNILPGISSLAYRGGSWRVT